MSDTQLSPDAQAIVSAHRAMALPAQSPGVPRFNHDDACYQAAKTACLALGFADADAECVACAWSRQTRRLGYFDPGAWPDKPMDYSLPDAAPGSAFASCPRSLGLYAVLPNAEWIPRMAQAGVPTLQLRFKSSDAGEIEREVQAAVRAVSGTSCLLFINDHWQAAIRAGAYGVHLGQEDLDQADLGAIQAAGLRLGLSTHGYAEMLRAAACHPSYLALGAVFPTTLKRMATAPQGLARLAAYARLMRHLPLVAIGGIDEARLPEVLRCGVGSVAVVRALVAAPDPQAAAQRMQQCIANTVRNSAII